MSKVYSWRKLNEKELTRVYLDEMRRDFPPTELKPLSMILNSEANGTAHTWGVFDGETLAAYLLMVRPAGSMVSQLDYFAVLPEYRAAGLGAQLLADLPQHERGAQAILIEAECPDKAEDETMAVRRLGFYARCGARDTGFTEHLFDAWFRILVLDCPGAGTFADLVLVQHEHGTVQAANAGAGNDLRVPVQLHQRAPHTHLIAAPGSAARQHQSFARSTAFIHCIRLL